MTMTAVCGHFSASNLTHLFFTFSSGSAVNIPIDCSWSPLSDPVASSVYSLGGWFGITIGRKGRLRECQNLNSQIFDYVAFHVDGLRICSDWIITEILEMDLKCFKTTITSMTSFSRSELVIAQPRKSALRITLGLRFSVHRQTRCQYTIQPTTDPRAASTMHESERRRIAFESEPRTNDVS